LAASAAIVARDLASPGHRFQRDTLARHASRHERTIIPLPLREVDAVVISEARTPCACAALRLVADGNCMHQAVQLIDADLLMLRKAYAAVLLKLRGQPMPLLAERDS